MSFVKGRCSEIYEGSVFKFGHVPSRFWAVTCNHETSNFVPNILVSLQSNWNRMFPVNKFPPWGFSSNLSPHYKNHAWMQDQFQVFDSGFTFQFELILLILRKYLFKVNNKDTEATFIILLKCRYHWHWACAWPLSYRLCCK